MIFFAKLIFLKRFLLVGCLGLLLSWGFSVRTLAGEGVLFEEAFADLDRWESLTFDSVPRHSTYQVEELDGKTVLLMESDNAGSALILQESFTFEEGMKLSWRWRVLEAIEGVNHTRKSGDVYPARVYVFFEYDGTGLSFGDRMRYRAYRTLRGEYPPHSGLSFVWTQVPVAQTSYGNPYTDRVGMKVLRGEDSQIGEWYEERVDLGDAYRRYFGKNPPRSPMRVAVMTDSEETGQQTKAQIEWLRLEVKKENSSE